MTIHSVPSATLIRPADQIRADKREAILRAATDTFAERGFFNAQVADVARAAGVAAGTVYLYFKGKDDLLVSIFERTMREAIADGRACVAPLRDPVEQLRAIARVHLDRMGSDRSLAVVFQVELRQSTKFMEQFSATLVREYLGVIRGIIVAGQGAGAFRREINATLAAKLFFGGLDEMARFLQERGQYVAKCAVVVDEQDAPGGHNGGGGHHKLSWDATGRPEGFYGPRT